MNEDDPRLKTFVGVTEKRLVKKLVEQGYLNIEEIYGSYSSRLLPKYFMQKCITYKLVRFSDKKSNFLEYVEQQRITQ